MVNNEKSISIKKETFLQATDIPIGLCWDKKTQSLCLTWLRSAHFQLQHGFFNHDIKWIRSKDKACFIFKTDFEKAFNRFEKNDCLRAPEVLLFHISHCGSTLTSRLFGCMPNTIMLSEPTIVNQALGMQSILGEKQMSSLIRKLFLLLGNTCLQGSQEGKYGFKLSSWNILMFEQIKSAFPNTPCFFLYRNPMEVMPSLVRKCKKRGELFNRLAVLKNRRDQLAYGEASLVSPEIESAQLLDIYFREFWKYREQFSVVLEYPEISKRIIAIMENVLGQKATIATLRKINTTFQLNAKRQNPIRFIPDRRRKISALTVAMQLALETTASIRYQEINAWKAKLRLKNELSIL